MDAVVLQLGIGLGLQSAIGWFQPILYGMVNTLPMLLTLFLYADRSSEYNKKIKQKKYDSDIKPDLEYDFIVVGGGSAGSVVANRLSEHFSVLLLEQGGEPNPLTTVPGLQGALLSRPETDHMYLTVPQNSSCLGMKNKQCIWNAGKGLGGSSMINGMVYIRGHPFDYNRWSNITKDDRWRYKNLLPYFLRSEGYCRDCDPSDGVKPTINPKYHNSVGELTVRPLPLTPLATEFLEAQKWGGVDRGDLNAPYYKPITDPISLTINRGRRMSAYHAFVAPLLGKRSSLTVVKYARVIQVLFRDDGTNEAIGVKYERFGKIREARATNEVILSAGAIATPKLLMLSGIGPSKHLKKLKIPVRCNLPVGRNVQDHVGTPLHFLLDDSGPLSLIPERDLDENAVNSFLQNGTGPLAIHALRAQSFWVSSRAFQSGEENWPDLQITMSSNSLSQSTISNYERNYNMRRGILEEYFQPVLGRNAVTFMISFTRPHSRGVIKLKSSDFMDDPLIDPGYFEDAEKYDMEVAVEGIQRAIYLVENAPSYKKIGAKLSPIPFPPCGKFIFRSAEYWECYVRHFSLSRRHFAGSAAMGSVDSPKAVVDPELRVIGAKRLRVIDASVMPYVVSTNSNAPTIMIGERGADFILAKFLNSRLLTKYVNTIN